MCYYSRGNRRRDFKRYQIPVYFSGENARNQMRKSLDYIRKGQFEGLREVAHLPEAGT